MKGTYVIRRAQLVGSPFLDELMARQNQYDTYEDKAGLLS